MKIGKAEGTPEEITNIFQMNGLSLLDYLEKPQIPLPARWIVFSVVLTFGVALCLKLITLPTKIHDAIFILGLFSIAWLATCIQIRFKSKTATTFLAIVLILIILVAANYIMPEKIPDVIQALLHEK